MSATNTTAGLEKKPNTAGLPVLRIEPSRGWVSLKLKELWEYKELLYFLVWRDIKVRLKQTVLVKWSLSAVGRNTVEPGITLVTLRNEG